jgi:hypothetical protein
MFKKLIAKLNDLKFLAGFLVAVCGAASATTLFYTKLAKKADVEASVTTHNGYPGAHPLFVSSVAKVTGDYHDLDKQLSTVKARQDIMHEQQNRIEDKLDYIISGRPRTTPPPAPRTEDPPLP